ncbi:[acyl-carrier-protein] S-malonyltransferase [Malassezia equina]|uniref:[acyl-carrier-protein] S-malonyltransferase n=1 Tax=Malassezia equina TaxID=1381935 RepID=A0AAF0J1X1_9BASI|nr:[acyl-carrier-protein] S-malonyltransferase [Malassezia equina]
MLPRRVPVFVPGQRLSRRHYSTRDDDHDNQGPRRSQAMTASMVSGRANPVQFVRAREGKGAVMNYGMRRRSPARRNEISDEVESRRQLAPGARRPLPEAQTFSLPSSSFNASSWVSSGVAPPLAGRNAAGVGEGYAGRSIERKPTALILPGQGSQHVTMAHDLYNEYKAAREVWEEAEYHLSSFFQGKPVQGAPDHPLRDAFEQQLLQGQALDRHVRPPGANRSPGWFTDMVFGGSQLELTRPENAMPAILTVTLSFMRVLRREFGVDLIKDHIHWAAGHGSGVYGSLIATKSLLFCDALRAVRYRGLEAARCLEHHPILFPEGCERPASMFETWGFTNISSGKGGQLHVTSDDVTRDQPQKAHWRGTQVSAIVLRPGMLDRALQEVQALQHEIEQGAVPGIAPQEFVATANINSQVQIVLAGTTVGVNYACDRLNFRGIGARAVNLPVSGPYHTSFVDEAAHAYGRVVDVLPIEPPSSSMRLISSVDGREIKTVDELRHDLRIALNKPVCWLKTIDTLVSQGVKRFVCLGPGRTIAQQLSRELGLREQARVKAAGPHALARKGTLDEEASEFEVWSIATAEGLNQLVSAVRGLSPAPPP